MRPRDRRMSSRSDVQDLSWPRNPLYELVAGVYCREDPHYWYGMNLEDPNERSYDAAAAVFLIEIAKVADRFRAPTDLEPAGHSATHSAGQGEPLR